MRSFSYVAILIGLLSYAVALGSIGTMRAEILSDLGNGAFLMACAALLLRLNQRNDRVDRSHGNSALFD